MGFVLHIVLNRLNHDYIDEIAVLTFREVLYKCNSCPDLYPNSSAGKPMKLPCCSQPVASLPVVINMMPHDATSHIVLAEQQVMPQTRILHIAI